MFFFVLRIIWFYPFCFKGYKSACFELECSDEAHFTVEEKLCFLLLWWYSHCHKNTSAWNAEPILKQSSSPHCISAFHNWCKGSFHRQLEASYSDSCKLKLYKIPLQRDQSIHYSPPVLVWLHSQTWTSSAVKPGIRTVIRSREDLYPL